LDVADAVTQSWSRGLSGGQTKGKSMQTAIPPFPLSDPLDERITPARPDALITLYDRTVDSMRGFAKMVEKAEPSFLDTAEKFRSLHARHAGDLARLLSERGVETEADGTIMGTVNEAVITFRAFFDDIDEDMMDQVRSGERWVLSAFDDAIAELGPEGASASLREMHAELTELLADTQHLG
jgi:hypothetical protein